MYKEIASNKRKSYLLMFLFSLFVIGIGIVFGYINGNPWLYVIPAFLISIVSSLAGYYGSSSLVLGISGAKEITEKNYPEIYHILENLCITTGLKTPPKLYLIHDEAPNAFATGRDPEHSSIAVTTGLLKRLKRAEIEGVIAHELAHVINYDIRLATLVVVFVGVIVLMSDFFLRFTFWGGGRSRRSDSGGGKLGLILFVVGIVLAILSPIIAKLMQLAISRKREYLADAKGALITRYPEGLARALEKIADDPHPLKSSNKATAHLYIYNPLKDYDETFLNRLFSTHPPIEERVKRLRKMGH